MEDLLHNIKLFNLYHNIEVGMFTDDLTAFTTGKDLATLENRLNGLIEKIENWNNNHNMILSEKKENVLLYFLPIKRMKDNLLY